MNKSQCFIVTIVLSLGTLKSFSQTMAEGDFPKDLKTYNVERPVSVDYYRAPYLVNDKKLATYFKDETIPTDFPKYDYSIAKKDNLTIVKNWYNANNNKSLLSSAGEVKINEMLTKLSSVK